MDICRILHPNTAEYTFISALLGIFFETDHMRHKVTLNKPG